MPCEALDCAALKCSVLKYQMYKDLPVCGDNEEFYLTLFDFCYHQEEQLPNSPHAPIDCGVGPCMNSDNCCYANCTRIYGELLEHGACSNKVYHDINEFCQDYCPAKIAIPLRDNCGPGKDQHCKADECCDSNECEAPDVVRNFCHPVTFDIVDYPTSYCWEHCNPPLEFIDCFWDESEGCT